ncbi:hypothetical protein J6590_092865, partial [Homalodisca vitripennis]
MASLLKRVRQCSRRVVYPWKFNLHGKPIDLNFRPYATVKYKTNSDSKKTKCRILCCPLRPYASEYGDPLSNPRQKKPVNWTVGPRSRPGTHCPPLQKQVRNYPDSFTTWTY